MNHSESYQYEKLPAYRRKFLSRKTDNRLRTSPCLFTFLPNTAYYESEVEICKGAYSGVGAINISPILRFTYPSSKKRAGSSTRPVS